MKTLLVGVLFLGCLIGCGGEYYYQGETERRTENDCAIHGLYDVEVYVDFSQRNDFPRGLRFNTTYDTSMYEDCSNRVMVSEAKITENCFTRETFELFEWDTDMLGAGGLWTLDTYCSGHFVNGVVGTFRSSYSPVNTH